MIDYKVKLTTVLFVLSLSSCESTLSSGANAGAGSLYNSVSKDFEQSITTEQQDFYQQGANTGQ